MTRPLIVQQGCIVPQSVYRLPWECFVLFLLWNPILPKGPNDTFAKKCKNIKKHTNKNVWFRIRDRSADDYD